MARAEKCFILRSFYLLLISLLFVNEIKCEYQIPDVTITILRPRGFRVSIPDEPGIKSFTFNGKINEEINGLGRGTFSILVTKPIGGYWIYENRDTPLGIGDAINYWVKVNYFNGVREVEYYKDQQEYRVAGFLSNSNVKNSSAALSTTTSSTSIEIKKPYQIPNAIVQAYSPSGLRISIPHEEGIQLFSVRINTFEEENVTNVTQPVNGFWTYLNKNLKLELNDVIQYQFRIYHFDGEQTHAYYKENSFMVQELVPSSTEVNVETKQEYKIPDVTIKALRSRGFKISIPHQDGVQLFSIRGRLSGKVNSRKEVQFSTNVTQAIEGYWTYYNNDIKLVLGDVIYYWITVDYFDGTNLKQYYKNNQVFIVQEFFPALEETIITSTIRTTSTTTTVRVDYAIPRVTIQPLWPKGLKVSIPDERGVKSFAFHANINDRIKNREEGTLSKEIDLAVNGSWAIHFHLINLERGDVIYYWVRINYFDGNQIIKLYNDNQIFIVKEIVPSSNLEVEEASSSTTTSTTTVRTKPKFPIPDVIIEPLRPKGLRVSIPDWEGIRLFALHANINQKIGSREAGTISKAIVESSNGFWTYLDENIKLSTGDEIYYWAQIDCFDGIERVEHYKDDQVFIVTEDKFSDIAPSSFDDDDDSGNQTRYEIPDVLIEAYWPKGLKISIPDKEGIQMFEFHGKINEFIRAREEGALSKDVIQAVDGRWTYFNSNVELKMGNVIYYWVKVDYLIGNQIVSYYKENNFFIIPELMGNDNAESTTARLTTTTTSKTDFAIPDVLIEIFAPRGLKVSIPHMEGIKSFSFHAKINREMLEREEGTFSKDVTRATNGRWTYTDKSARLEISDVIHYWIKIDYYDGVRRVSHYKDNQTFIVTELISTDEDFNGTSASPLASSTTQKSTTESSQCGYTPTIVNGKSSCKGRLIFQETFGELSERKWLREIKFAGDPDYEFVIYTNDKENLFLERSMLHIKPTLLEDRYGSGFASRSGGLDLGENCTGVAGSLDCLQKPKAWLVLPPVISAQITTKNYFSFVYGVIEIRARLPQGDWLYPELYLKPKKDDYGLGYESGLIKFAFAPGNDDLSKTLTGGCVLGQSVAARNYAVKTFESERRWTNDFHVFKIEWKTDGIVLSVNDQIYGNVFPPEGGFSNQAAELELDAATVQRWKKGTELAPFDKEMYVVLGVGAGGQCFLNKKGENKPWDNTDPKAQLHFYRAQDIWSKTWSDRSALIVDYVKVWAL